MRAIIAALVIALIALTATPAHAAKPAPAPSATTITLDGDASLPLADVARDWSKNTGVKVVVGPCSGTNCVHFTILETIPCASGGIIVGTVGGCAHASADPGACQVDLYGPSLRSNANLALYITKHEAGHCVYWFGGAGFIHLNSTRALMKDGFAGIPTPQDTALTSEDRRFALNLFR